MATLTEDLRAFLALHHRVVTLNVEERARSDALRDRVQAAFRLPPPAPPR